MESPPQDLKISINPADGTALIEFNRPKKRNAFSQTMIGEMVATLASLDADPAVRAIVVTGSPGGPFCGKSSAIFLRAMIKGGYDRIGS